LEFVQIALAFLLVALEALVEAEVVELLGLH
jgi:hypothetical protein